VNLSDLFTPEQLEHAFLRYVSPSEVPAENARLQIEMKEIERYETTAKGYVRVPILISSVMGTLLVIHDTLRRREPSVSLLDLMSVEEYHAEMARTCAAERVDPEPLVIPYCAVVNKLGVPKEIFVVVMGTLAVLQRVLAKKAVQ
jgi:hypothetical protein